MRYGIPRDVLQDYGEKYIRTEKNFGFWESAFFSLNTLSVGAPSDFMSNTTKAGKRERTKNGV